MSESLPREIRNAYWFQAFNAVSWQIALGTPIILFAQRMGASATTLGLLAGLAPMMSILQLPVSRYAEDIGYRKLMLTGWSARVCMLVFLTLLPFGHAFLPDATLVNLLLAIMFFFTMLRGLSTCAWLPWNSSIVPASLRGTYLGRERAFINSACVMALLLSGAVVSRNSGMGSYAFMFFMSFAAGAASLYFLNRIPEPPSSAPHVVIANAAITWSEIFHDVPFRRLLMFSFSMQLALSANGTFLIIFLHEQINFSDRTIIWLSAGSALLGMAALSFLGGWMDRHGSKPYLGLAWLWCLAHIGLWFLATMHAMEHLRLLAISLMLVNGFFSSIYELSLMRLLLNTVGDKPGKARYFAVYGVAVSLVVGVVPVLWGMLLDGLRNWNTTFASMEINRFTVFFACEGAMVLAIGIMLARLHESRSLSATFMVYEIFVGMPTRGLSILLQRFR